MGEPERVFFVHLQKTAGTSLFLAMRRALGDEAVYPMPDEPGTEWPNTDVEALLDAFQQRGDSIQVVAGHFPLCVVDLLGVPFTTVTVLRDPFPRTLSFLRHRRDKIPERAGASLDELYAEPRMLLALIHNHMTKMLGITPEQMTHGVATMVDFDEGFLRRAEEGLERIDVVGIQERYGEFWAEVEDRFGWDLGIIPHANTTEAEPGDVSEWLEQRIRADNELDFELYRYAVDLVERRRAGRS